MPIQNNTKINFSNMGIADVDLLIAIAETNKNAASSAKEQRAWLKTELLCISLLGAVEQFMTIKDDSKSSSSIKGARTIQADALKLAQQAWLEAQELERAA